MVGQITFLIRSLGVNRFRIRILTYAPGPQCVIRARLCTTRARLHRDRAAPFASGHGQRAIIGRAALDRRRVAMARAVAAHPSIDSIEPARKLWSQVVGAHQESVVILD